MWWQIQLRCIILWQSEYYFIRRRPGWVIRVLAWWLFVLLGDKGRTSVTGVVHFYAYVSCQASWMALHNYLENEYAVETPLQEGLPVQDKTLSPPRPTPNRVQPTQTDFRKSCLQLYSVLAILTSKHNKNETPVKPWKQACPYVSQTTIITCIKKAQF